MAEAKPAPVADRVMLSVRSSDLTVAEQQRVKAMQRLAHVSRSAINDRAPPLFDRR